MAITYTTWNSDDKSANITLSNGDLTATSINQAWKSVRATKGKSAGKWYWEVTISVDADRCLVGVGTIDESVDTYVGDTVYGYSYYSPDGNKFHDDTGTSYGSGFTTNDIIGVALDLDNGKIWFSKNGAWQNSGDPEADTGEAWSGLSGTFFPMYSPYSNTEAATANFGASAFSHSVPSGFESGFYSGTVEDFTFTNPIPTHLSTVYGTTEQLYLTTTISGDDPDYIYDASFYDSFDVQIGTTVSGIPSGDQAASNAYLSTPSGIDYDWYVTATSSGGEGTSSTYTFHNRFLASGTTKVDGVLTSGIDVRLYRRDTGELVGDSISTVSGIFDIETQYDIESYCVALSPYTDTNSLIYDFLEFGD